MYLSDNKNLKKYEIKSFDESCPVQVKGEKKIFTAYREGGVKKAVFFPIYGSGDSQGNDAFDISGTAAAEREARLEREAYEKGFAQGEKDGLELGAAKAGKISAQIEKLLEEISRLRADLIKQYEKDILKMVCAVAQKIVCREVTLDNTAVREAVIRSIDLATEKRSVHLKVNKEDFDYIEGMKPELFSRFNELGQVVVSADPGIKRGGCFLETSYGDVDARMETQLDLIQRTLENAYAGKPDE
jgi:flagellar assembly protein FliH